MSRYDTSYERMSNENNKRRGVVIKPVEPPPLATLKLDFKFKTLPQYEEACRTFLDYLITTYPTRYTCRLHVYISAQHWFYGRAYGLSSSGRLPTGYKSSIRVATGPPKAPYSLKHVLTILAHEYRHVLQRDEIHDDADWRVDGPKLKALEQDARDFGRAAVEKYFQESGK